MRRICVTGFRFYIGYVFTAWPNLQEIAALETLAIFYLERYELLQRNINGNFTAKMSEYYVVCL